MTCDGCAGGIRSELLRTKGVAAAEVSHKTGQAIVIANTNQTSAAQLAGAIKEAGFEAKIQAP
jgi:copper chaperone CopZ